MIKGWCKIVKSTRKGYKKGSHGFVDVWKWNVFEEDMCLNMTCVWRWNVFEDEMCLKTTCVWRWRVWRWHVVEDDMCLKDEMCLKIKRWKVYKDVKRCIKMKCVQGCKLKSGYCIDIGWAGAAHI